jgi:hypothetical protein
MSYESIRNRRRKPADVVLADLRTFAKYNPETGCFICTRQRTPNAPEVGSVLGFKVRGNYLSLFVAGGSYPVHRLAFLWMTGKWPTEIDHKDGNRQNNKWSNLSEGENVKNKSLYCNNSSGVPGVYRTGSGKWAAQVGVNKKNRYIGTFNSKEDAIAARLDYVKTHPELGFSERHGSSNNPSTEV